MKTGSYHQIDIRRWNIELLEKDIGKLWIVMLTGVDKDFRMVVPQFSADSRSFDELRPRAHD
jgi:hypothetical protein